MRKESQVWLVVIGVSLLAGCAPKMSELGSAGLGKGLGTTQPGRDPLGNTLPNTWQRLAGKLSSAGQDGKASQSSDPLRLANGPGAPTPALYVSMAKLFEQSGKIEAAAAHLDKALSLNDKDLPALLAYAHLHDRQGQMPAALQKYELACRYHPQAAGAYNDLGLCLARLNRLPDSVGPLRHAISLKPQRKLYRNNLATVFVEMGRVDEAVQELRAVHGDAIAHYNVGFLLQKRGQNQLAMQHFANAARLDPTLTAARQWANHLHRSAQRVQTQMPQVSPQQTQSYPAVSSRPSPVGQRYQNYDRKQ